MPIGSETWPPDDGWHFREQEAAFLGRKFEIAGRQKDTLKVLAEARSRLTIQAIADGVSHDNQLGSKTIRGYLSEVRTLLRSAFIVDQSKDKNAPIISKGRGEEALWSLDLESISVPAHFQR
ncbi:hypothetical protein LBMAG52_41650 [Planctomycetia bacterium]|nr:hypothetical protein LBMAG52_41650 [Planctomycetia bacterium]